MNCARASGKIIARAAAPALDALTSVIAVPPAQPGLIARLHACPLLQRSAPERVRCSVPVLLRAWTRANPLVSAPPIPHPARGEFRPASPLPWASSRAEHVARTWKAYGVNRGAVRRSDQDQCLHAFLPMARVVAARGAG